MITNFKISKIRSEKHLAYIRSQPCIITGYVGEAVVAHHLLRMGGKGLGTKACDSLVVPLTSFMHDMLHRNGNEVAFFANHGKPYETIQSIVEQLALKSPDKRISNKVKVTQDNIKVKEV